MKKLKFILSMLITGMAIIAVSLLTNCSKEDDLLFEDESIEAGSRLKASGQCTKSGSTWTGKVDGVVEDNDELRNYMVSNLSRSFKIIEASNGTTGLKLVREESPDLLVCDIMLPELDGISLCKILKKNFNTCHIPVIIITSNTSEDQRMEGIDIGADDYIYKPFSFQYLERRIQGIINQRKILKEKFTIDPGIKPEKLSSSPSDQKFLTDVIQKIEENLKKPDFSIDKIVTELGYGRTVFYKKMKALTGEPPNDFVRTVKMKKAASLLRDTGKLITSISFELGFNNPDYFTKTFKSYFGETPSEYQKKFK